MKDKELARDILQIMQSEQGYRDVTSHFGEPTLLQELDFIAQEQSTGLPDATERVLNKILKLHGKEWVEKQLEEIE